MAAQHVLDVELLDQRDEDDGQRGGDDDADRPEQRGEVGLVDLPPDGARLHRRNVTVDCADLIDRADAQVG